MQGHAVANVMPVVASNRIGFEPSPNYSGETGGGQTFYGSSFIADHRGDLVASFERQDEGVLTHTFDLDFLQTHRAAWGFFRDRRTDLYGSLIRRD
jgi:N-carbamoylputrescine amidase